MHKQNRWGGGQTKSTWKRSKEGSAQKNPA